MSKQSIEAKTEELLTPVLEEMAFELVDVEYVKEGADYYLRAYIDKDGGITVNDCEAVSRRLEVLLDAEDFISGGYILEVSSPGLTRALKKEKDYIRNIGRPVEVHTFKPVDGVKEFIGDLLRYDKDTVVLDVGQEEPEEAVIPRDNISMIRQYFEF
ncbi:MAG: ribosome maturation factor RimP [Parasporobacterium sp.]|nr:ribosome maturation factor RimP [Parasporobacterium sp.]